MSVKVWCETHERSTSSGDTISYTFDISPKPGRPPEDDQDGAEFGWDECRPPARPNLSTRYRSGSSDRIRGPFPLPVDFPRIAVNHFGEPADGFFFTSDFAWTTALPPIPAAYLMILDNTGFPVFFRRKDAAMLDFKKQPNGLLTYYDNNIRKFFGMDSTYTVVDSFQCGNGYSTDLHDLQILPNGHALLMSYDLQIIDMSKVVPGGDPQARVLGLIVQELDRSKNVVFQWRSWDHFEITDGTNMDFKAANINYVHGNAIESDKDGNLLISCRNMDSVVKISRSTGDIIWRLGGKKNQFAFVNNVGGPDVFSRQHDIRRVSNGHITVYDNGTFHQPQFSRAVEYELDEINLTATLVWQYRNAPDIYARFLGNAQRLPNGNTLIGWGGTNPTVTEVRPDGSKTVEFTFDTDIYSYRSFRFPWKGNATAPYLWEATTGDTVILGFAKFGDERVQKYYLYRGEAPNPTVPVASTAGHSLIVRNFERGDTLYFRVRARREDGLLTPFSNEIKVTPTFSDTLPPPRVPKTLVLERNYPNPFNSTTTIRYSVPVSAHVELTVADVLGRLVAVLVDEVKPPNTYEVDWKGLDKSRVAVASGIYFVRLASNGEVRTIKIVLLK